MTRQLILALWNLWTFILILTSLKTLLLITWFMVHWVFILNGIIVRWLYFFGTLVKLVVDLCSNHVYILTFRFKWIIRHSSRSWNIVTQTHWINLLDTNLTHCWWETLVSYKLLFLIIDSIRNERIYFSRPIWNFIFDILILMYATGSKVKSKGICFNIMLNDNTLDDILIWIL